MEITLRGDDIASIFDKGLQAHNAGDLIAAEQLYQETLSIQPNHCEANHNIGVVLAAKNKLDEALKFFKYALDSSPNVSLFWASYIDALIKLERIAESKTLIKAVKDAGISCDKIEAISQRLDVEHQEPGPKDTQELNELIELQKFDEAIQACLSLMDTYPSSAVLNINLGKCYFELGQINQSISSYKKGTQYQPSWAVGFAMLGHLYSSQGNANQAIASLKTALGLQPDDQELNFTLGVELFQNEDVDEAIKYLKKALTQEPNSSSTLSILGGAYSKKGDHKLAISYYKKALKLDPNDEKLHFNIGNALQAEDSFDTAIKSYQQAIKIKPNDADVYTNMGVAFKAKGDLDAAITSFKQALKINPKHAETYNNMGIAFYDQGDLDAAIDSYTKAIKIKPDYAEVYSNMGLLLKAKGDLSAAKKFHNMSVNINPQNAEVHCNMGLFLSDSGDPKAAIKFHSKSLKINPNYDYARAHKLSQQANICDWAAIKEDSSLIPKLGTLAEKVTPFGMLAMEDEPMHHRLRSEVFIANNWPQNPLPPRLKPSQKPKRLRIGYFSADFHNHATMCLMAKVFEAHNQEKFELYAYSFGPKSNDEMRQRLVKSVDVFADVRMKGDKDIALLAQRDKIDIAVDLKGYTGSSRFGIFAYRAAPIQISYLGYPGTSGAATIDYLIADKVVIPSQFETSYSESIIYLPHSYQGNDNTRVISDNTVTKLEMGLPEQGFVFCCFNSNYKISPAEFDIWMRLLHKVKGSVLWLLKSNKWAEQNLRLQAEYRGIPGDRLVFANIAPNAEHLARHRLADLFIDTFNVNAHTTASDALWAGLPVVTKLGNGFAARVAGSLLTAIDLAELITETEQEYEELILDLATNTKRLAAIKKKLITNRLSKPLFNTELFTKHLENGYQQAYDLYFTGKKPDTIMVCDQFI